MITPSQYTRTYDQYKKVLRIYADAIANSGTARAYIMKNLEEGDAEELLIAAVNCIADITGDEVLRKKIKERKS